MAVPDPRRRARTIRLAAVLLVALAATPAAGCTGAKPTPACQSLGDPVLPDTAGSLDQTSTGAYCLPPGQRIAVFLHAGTAGTPRWGAIASSDSTVLQAQRAGVLTPPVGVTPGIFAAVSTGSATLRSDRGDGTVWQVTIVVG